MKLRNKKKIVFIILIFIAIISAIVFISFRKSTKIRAVAQIKRTGLVSEMTSSVYIKDIVYSGTTNVNNAIDGALCSSKQMYSDTAETFTTVPPMCENAEYFKLPSIDNELSSSNDILSFTTKKDVNIFIFKDARIAVPNWMSDYTLNEKTIVGGNGVEYKIYNKEVAKGTSVSIGTTSGDSNDGNSGVANIIAIKSISEIENGYMFYEDFSNVDKDSIINGFGGIINTNTDMEIDTEKFASDPLHGATLHLMDNNSEATDSNPDNLAFIQKSFANQSEEVTFSFDAYVTDLAGNEYLRFYLLNDPAIDYADKSHNVIESYLYRRDSYVNYFYDKIQGVKHTEISTKVPVNAWHNYKVVLNCANKTYSVYVDDDIILENANFLITQNINTFILGTGQAYKSDYYVDNIKIIPQKKDVVRGIKINGNELQGFSEENRTYCYTDTVINDSSNIEIIEGLNYKSFTKEYIPDAPTNSAKLIITINDYYNHSYVYTIDNSETVDLLKDYTVVGDNGTTLRASNERYSGYDTIRLYDNVYAEKKQIYMYKNVGVHENEVRFSYDFNIPSGTEENKWNRITLNYGAPENATSTKGRAIETILSKNGDKIIMTCRTETTGKEDIVLRENYMKFDEWNHVEYNLNFNTKTYEIYINGTSAAYKLPFVYGFSSNKVDTVFFSTGANDKNNVYYANINVEEVYGYPIDSIKINNSKLTSFKQNIFSYEAYSELSFEVSNCIAVTNSYLKTISYNKDTENKEFIITAVNKGNEVYEYKIYFKELTDINASIEDLEKLIEESYKEYPDSTKDEYVERTWDDLRNKLKNAQDIVDSSNPTDTQISVCYYEIKTALSNMLKYLFYNYDSGIIEIVKYSEDLDGLFEINKVLENGVEIYKGSYETYYSVPYKMWNSEYFTINKNLDTLNGALQFKALTNIDVFIGYDRKAGVLADSSYTETGDIITSSDGTIYKIYKRSFNKGDIITLDYYNCIQSTEYAQNSIIAVKDSSLTDNVSFVNEKSENMSDERLQNMWDLVLPKTSSGNNYINIMDFQNPNSGLTEKVLQFRSDSTSSMGYMYQKFAKMTDKFTFSFSVLNPGLLTESGSNLYSRTWLLQNEPTDWNNAQNNSEKKNILMDAYIDSNWTKGINQKLSLMYASGKYYGTPIPLNTWGTAKYTVDMKNKKLYASFDGNDDLDISNTIVNNLNYINYVAFATRKSGKTWMYFKDLEIKPIERNIINSISVEGNAFDDSIYHELTKDYLYKYDTTLDENAVSINQGTAYDNSSTIVQKTDANNCAKINLVDSNDGYTIENRIYFEMKVDKKILTQYIKEVGELDLKVYTDESVSELLKAYEDGKKILARFDVNQNEIDTSAELIRNKIDALVRKDNTTIIIKANLYYGRDLKLIDETVNASITNNSSITLETNISKSFSSEYVSKNEEHIRKLISSVSLPENTKITLIDKTDENDWKYYYYIVTNLDATSDKKIFLLSDFKMMGTTNSNFKNTNRYDDINLKMNESLGFIIDYSDVSESKKLQESTYGIKYEIVAGTTTISMDSVSIDNTKYFVDDTEETDIVNSYIDTITGQQGKPISFEIYNKYTKKASSKIAENTETEEHKLGVLVSLVKDGVNIGIPNGMKVELSSNGSIINADGKTALIFSNTVKTIETPLMMTISQNSKNIIESGDYNILIELIESYDGLNYGKVVSTKEIQYNLIDELSYGIHATMADGYIPVIKHGESTKIKFKVNTQYDGEQDNLYTTFKLYSKDEYGNYVEIDLKDYILETLTMTSQSREYVYNEDEIFTILNSLTEGTYRFEFKLYNDDLYTNVMASDVQNVVVK